MKKEIEEDKEITPYVNEELEEEFFSLHGVGEMAVEKEMRPFSKHIDKMRPSPREKDFCRHIVAGKSYTDAYILAFNKTGQVVNRPAIANYASALLKRKRVATYYMEQLEKRDALADEQLPELINQLNEDRELARALGQPSAAIQAVKTKANLLGLENQKPANLTVNLGITDAQREAILNRIATRAQLVKENEDAADYIDIEEYNEIENGDKE